VKKYNKFEGKKKNILIIGAGIHGSFLALYLKKKFNSVNIDIIDKNNSICSGTSASTHNRANRGYHYPRSPKTSKECSKGWIYFKNNYGQFLKIIDSFYAVEKNSKTNPKKYEKFLKKNNLYYRIENSDYFNKKKISICFKAFEGCFNHEKIVRHFYKQFKKKKIKLINNFELKKVSFSKNKKNIILFSSKKKTINKNYDIIFNSTYDNANEILKKFKIKKLIKQKIQYTSIPVVESKKKIPGLTVMDGDYVTLMPYLGNKNKYLLYDCINSISYKSHKNIATMKNYYKILKRFKEYYLLGKDFKFSKFLLGKRPIQIRDKNADRYTFVTKNQFNKIPLYSIYEGKYISAAYFTKKLVSKIKL